MLWKVMSKTDRSGDDDEETQPILGGAGSGVFPPQTFTKSNARKKCFHFMGVSGFVFAILISLIGIFVVTVQQLQKRHFFGPNAQWAEMRNARAEGAIGAVRRQIKTKQIQAMSVVPATDYFYSGVF